MAGNNINKKMPYEQSDINGVIISSQSIVRFFLLNWIRCTFRIIRTRIFYSSIALYLLRLGRVREKNHNHLHHIWRNTLFPSPNFFHSERGANASTSWYYFCAYSPDLWINLFRHSAATLLLILIIISVLPENLRTQCYRLSQV